MGGTDDQLLDVFDRAVAGGSVKFNSALSFNDPFEFKFTSEAPSRSEFDQWHQKHDPNRTDDELENAWRSFHGPAKGFNTNFLPRAQLMEKLFVLCLAQSWNSHLMWAHYAGDHRGFAICYRSELIETLKRLDGYIGDGNVNYSNSVPQLRWFSCLHSEMISEIVATKSSDWAYEKEYRILVHDELKEKAVFETIDATLISGVILGARVSPALREKALAMQDARNDFTAKQVSASSTDSYKLEAQPIVPNTRKFSEFL